MELKNILIGFLLVTSIGSGANTLQDIVETNDRINRLSYIADVSDEWLTPNEMLNNGGGDCEDFAISKYWDLRFKGFKSEDLLISYVNVQDIPQPHMVLIVNFKGDQFVLDNVSKLVLKQSERPDLKIVYQFNEDYIYSKGANAGSANVIKRWSHIVNTVNTN
ncbi:transglutaminase-like cysteine peptidase [Vibrio vulnificus]|nr:transglutaminase-like cysteine peptidase [Vibrio vulnificus]